MTALRSSDFREMTPAIRASELLADSPDRAEALRTARAWHKIATDDAAKAVPGAPGAVIFWANVAAILSTSPATLTFIQTMVARGALFVLNHSAGKDSQAQQIVMEALVPHSQIVVAHADLGEVEWDGCEEHIHGTVTPGIEVIVCRAAKTFFDMVERRQMFPSPSNRQCTSDLKRDPISKAIRHHLKAHPEFNGLVVNCMGLRAQESSGRAKATKIKLNPRNSVAGREWYDVLPIHDLTEAQVFATISAAGQEPHWVYAQGMTRKSCCFCIMACDADLKRASELRPELARKYATTERRINFTVSMRGKPLSEIVGRDLLA